MRRRLQGLNPAYWLLLLSLSFLSACENTATSSTKATPTVHVQPASKVDESNLWHYITNRYRLEGYGHKQLDGHLRWFVKNPDYLTRVTGRAQPYLHWVVQEVERAGLPMEIALLPIVESAYYPFSFSHGTASGLWQFIPSTGKLYGLDEDWWYDERRDVVHSTKAAIQYLKNLSKLFNGDYLLAIAAYNSGPGRVQRAIAKNKRLGKKHDFWHLDLPLETRGYVPRLLAVATLIKYPEQYGQVLTPVANQRAVELVSVDQQLDLALVSQWTGLSIEDIYRFNPGLKRWATPDVKHYELLLPVAVVGDFKTALAKSDPSTRIKWVRHQIKSGQTLSQIAKQYKTTMAKIKAVNELNQSKIRAGDYLIVPVARLADSQYLMSESERNKKRLSLKKNGKKVIHTMQKGDSLWGVARRYNTTVKNLIKWNQLSDVKAIPIGKELVLWLPNTAKHQDLKKIVDAVPHIDRQVTYRVKKGDNLSRIARKFDTTVAKIVKLNRLDIKQPLKIGQRLKISVNVLNADLK